MSLKTSLQLEPCLATTSRLPPSLRAPDQPLTVQLKLSMERVPLHLLQTVSKMSVPKNRTKKSDLILQKAGVDVVTYKMANGKIISSEGMPQGIDNAAMQKIIEAVDDKQTTK